WKKSCSNERCDGDRSRAARSGLHGRRGESGTDPRTHGGTPRAPRGRARAADGSSPRPRRRGRRRVRVMFDPEVETLPWEDQLALDDASFRAQLEYLRARSSFYRDRLPRVEGGGPLGVAQLPRTG